MVNNDATVIKKGLLLIVKALQSGIVLLCLDCYLPKHSQAVIQLLATGKIRVWERYGSGNNHLFDDSITISQA